MRNKLCQYWLVGVLSLGLCVVSGGCQGTDVEPDSLGESVYEFELVLDREVDPSRRQVMLNAWPDLEQLPEVQQQAAMSVLMRLILSDRQPMALRQLAVARLVAFDVDLLAMAAMPMLDRIGEVAVRGQLIEAIGRSFDDEASLSLDARRIAFEGALIRCMLNLYRESARRHRVDLPRMRAGLEYRMLNVGADDGGVADRLVTYWMDERAALRDRVAAWVLLNQLVAPGRVQEQVSGLSVQGSDDIFKRGLVEAGQLLDVLPATREQVAAWLMLVETDTDLNDLKGAKGGGVAMRHLGWLRSSSLDLRLERNTLVRRLADGIAERGVVQRTAARQLGSPVDERFSMHSRRLSWLDLLVLDRLQQVFAQPRVVRQLHEQVEADRADVTSEHGGLLEWDTDGLSVDAVAYSAGQVGNDQQYVASAVMMLQLHRSLGHYHFHVGGSGGGSGGGGEDIEAYAGPGLGDLNFVERHGVFGVVVTPVDAGLNVDVVVPTGGDYLVIDLGVFGD